MLFARDGQLVVVPIGEYITRAGWERRPGEVDSTERSVVSMDVVGTRREHVSGS